MTDPRADIRNAVNDAKPVLDGEGLAKLPYFHLVDSFQDQPVPARRWCVEGWIPDRQVTSLYGDGGTGKSLLALQLATACALGTEWLGIPVARRRVLLVSCEDDRDEIHRRLGPVVRQSGHDFGDMEGRFAFLDRAGEDSTFITFDKADKPRRTAFFDNVRRTALAFGAQLIIIDTAADTFGGNEIIRAQVTAFVKDLRRLAMDADGAVLLLAHPSVAGMREGHGFSGSTAWRGSVRSLLTFAFDDEDPSDPDRRILKRQKANHARSGVTIGLRYDAGVFVPLAPAVSGLDLFSDAEDDERFLDKLKGLLDRGLCPSASKNRKEYAPQLMKQTFAKELSAIAIGRLEAAQKRLFEAGRIAVKKTRFNTSPLCPEDYDVKKWRG